MFSVHVKGSFFCGQAVIPSMKERRSGKIVNISSDAGRVGSMGETVYAAAKGGIWARYYYALHLRAGQHGHQGRDLHLAIGKAEGFDIHQMVGALINLGCLRLFTFSYRFILADELHRQ